MVEDFIELSVKLLTSCRDFTVSSESIDDEIVFTVKISKEYAGRIIGRHGDTIKSLRSIVFSIMQHHYQRRSTIRIDVIEDVA